MLSSRSSHELLETKITIHSDDELDDHIRSESIALLRRRNSSELPHRISRVCINLHTYLVIGYRWILRFLALTFYSIFLLPGFVQRRVQRGVVYGDKPRNRLDLYLPSKANKSMPVVAFVTGGAWIIGYKAWGALLARQLQERNIIVACIDYRNFPQGSIGDMVKDVSNALSFLLKNAQSYGGDLNRMYLAGQSAGAHIAACTLVGQAQEEASKGQGCVDWSCSQFKAFFGISGCYNLMEVVDHFHSRGLYRSIFLSVMEGERALAKYSPELAIKSGEFDGCAAALLPCMVLLHGKADYSIPYSSSVAFGESLRSVKAKVIMKLYEDKTHTDLILQDPMRGGDDKVVIDIVGVMQDEDEELYVNLCGVSRKRMVPEWCLKLATNLSPF